MPITGIVVLPLTAVLLFCSWRRLLAFLFIVSGLLSDGAVVNFADFGLQPGYFVLLVVMLRGSLEMLRSNESIRRDLLMAVLPLFLFITISACALLVAEAIFDGGIIVKSSRDGLLSAGSPFHFRLENYAQHLYILINAIGGIIIAHKISRMSLAEARGMIDVSVFGFFLTAAAVTAWEYLHFETGIYFADDLFHSNVAYGQSFGQTFSLGHRLSGPFPEPSALAYYFAGGLLFSVRSYGLRKRTIALLSLLTCLLTLLISTSTSAYFFVAGFGVAVVLGNTRRVARLVTAGLSASRVNPRHLLICTICGTATLILLATNYDAMVHVMNEFIVEKPRSESFSQRSAADTMALDIAVQSWGIGLGLGSHKANILPLTILSNTGLVGFVAFCWFLWSCFRYADHGCAALPELQPIVSPLRWFLFALLLEHCFGAPNLNVLTFWIVIAFLLGTAALGADAAGQRASSPSLVTGPIAERERALV